MTTQELEILTELHAVNLMLAAIGESPVNSIDDTGLVDAVVARNTLRNASRQVQHRGYNFNTIPKVRLSPSLVDPIGTIRVEQGTLEAYATYTDAARDIVLRGEYLFDRENNTNVFTTGIYIGITQLLDFDSLPSCARDYIAIKAAAEFQQDRVGSVQLSAFHEQRRREAWQQLKRMETRTSKSNFLTGSVSVGNIVLRNRR